MMMTHDIFNSLKLVSVTAAAIGAAALLCACSGDGLEQASSGSADGEGLPEVTFRVGVSNGDDGATGNGLDVTRSAGVADVTRAQGGHDSYGSNKYFQGGETFFAYFPSHNTSVAENTYLVSARTGTNDYNEVTTDRLVLMSDPPTAGKMQCYMCPGRVVTNTTATFSVEKDQTSSGYAKSDLMYALADLNADGTAWNSLNDESKHVTFQHQMSKLIFKVKSTTGVFKMTDLRLVGGCRTTTLNTGSMPESLTTAATGFTPALSDPLNTDDYIDILKSSSTTLDNLSTSDNFCLVPPQTIAAGTTLVQLVTNKGAIFYRVNKQQTLKAGEAYELTLDATGVKDGASTVEISNWTTTGWAHRTQYQTAQGREFTVSNGGRQSSFNMVYVEGGSYSHTSPATVKGTLRDYYIAQTEVTQQLYRTVRGSLPAEPAQSMTGDDYPVAASYNDFLTFIDELNRLTQGQRPVGYVFAMPSNAQWEWAARGGQLQSTYQWAGTGTDTDDYTNSFAWESSNADGHAHPVAQKLANQLGLYDMTGNVGELCADTYSASDFPRLYTGGLTDDNQGTDYVHSYTGTNPVARVRGGNYNQANTANTISGASASTEISAATASVGLRLALVRRPKVGDFYFSDGSYGTLTVNSSGSATAKTVDNVVGIVLKSGTSLLDQQLGYHNGYVMALKNTGATNETLTQWCDENWKSNAVTDNQIPFVNDASSMSALYADMDGLTHCRTAYEHNGKSYEGLTAMKAAHEYPHATAPTGSSGWYLPSSGQFIAIFNNLWTTPYHDPLTGSGWSFYGIDNQAPRYQFNVGNLAYQPMQNFNSKMSSFGVTYDGFKEEYQESYILSTEASATAYYEFYLGGNFGFDYVARKDKTRNFYGAGSGVEDKVRPVLAF